MTKVEKINSSYLKDWAYVVDYRFGNWSFEVVYHPDGTLDTESDGSVEYTRQAVEAWTAWHEFVTTELPQRIEPSEQQTAKQISD